MHIAIADPMAALAGIVLLLIYMCLAIEVWTTRPRR